MVFSRVLEGIKVYIDQGGGACNALSKPGNAGCVSLPCPKQLFTVILSGCPRAPASIPCPRVCLHRTMTLFSSIQTGYRRKGSVRDPTADLVKVYSLTLPQLSTI